MLDIMPTDIDPQVAGSILESIFTQTVEYAFSQKAEPCGSLTCIYYDLKVRNHINLPVEAIVPIPRIIPETNSINVYQLPKVEQMASIIHRDSLSSLENAYNSLLGWIEKNNYQLIGSIREVYLEFDENNQPVVIEVQFPVDKI